jgi:hypothetical protein
MSNKSKRRTSPAIDRRGFIAAASLTGAAALTPPVVTEAASIRAGSSPQSRRVAETGGGSDEQ